MKSNRLPHSLFCKCLALLIFFSMSARAYSQQKPMQPKEMQPTWWFGLGGGANFNSYHGYTSALNIDINATPAFDKGHGVGGYYAALIEYHKPGKIWGLMLQQGGDSRRAKFTSSGRRLEARIGYFTIEPSITVSPFKRPLYFFAGPRFGLLWHTGFSYQNGTAPEYPQKNINPDAYIKNLDKITVSIQAGIGYNLMVGSDKRMNKMIISPFVTYLPSLDQNLRTIESLRLNTIRAGIFLKAGMKSQNP